MKRRDFLKTSLSAFAMASQSAIATSINKREFDELRAYRLKEGAGRQILESYLERALVPALNRHRAKPVGVFTEQEPRDGNNIWVLIPYPSLDSFSTTLAKLSSDPDYLKS